ncbi:MAG: minor capsid protein [Synergistaceae bacterium]
MTIVEAIQSMLTDSGITCVYIIDCPVKGDAVLITPYMTTPYDGVPIGEQRFQIYCASSKYVDSENLAWRVLRAVDGKSVPACDREILTPVNAIQEPFYLDKDAQGRYLHSFNIAVSAVWKGE